MSLLIPRTADIRSITTRFDFPSDGLHTLWPLFTQDLPKCETIDICPSWEHVRGQLDAGLEEYVSNISLSDERLPQLHRIRCYGIALPAAPAFWGRLSSLELVLSFQNEQEAVGVAVDLVSCIRHCAVLRRLRVADPIILLTVPRVSSGIPEVTPARCRLPIHLPFLEELFVDSTQSLFVVFLLASTRGGDRLAKVNIRSWMKPVNVSGIVHNLIPIGVRQCTLPRLKTMVMTANDVGTGLHTLGFWSSVPVPESLSLMRLHEDEAHHREDPNEFSFILRFVDPAGHSTDSVAILCDTFASCPLRELTLSDRPHPHDRARWARVFTTFRELRALRLLHLRTAEVVLLALAALTTYSAMNRGLSHPCAQALQTLSIFGTMRSSLVTQRALRALVLTKQSEQFVSVLMACEIGQELMGIK
ncbi:uncharacterized protein BXZ73DRAFT_75045 [Epithele typhae]|uniref:uncharacterized protein n=1 Tax=Epithele typhae TaxID=378194 RepID=UPI0020071F07|nr:uncharacterized protein BXZ73DRAFT_75045 [Epithele typhae]KAH9941881.1 hypothetical protein BXZ73DRAFT_75045 [Epithele typhae]